MRSNTRYADLNAKDAIGNTGITLIQDTGNTLTTTACSVLHPQAVIIDANSLFYRNCL